MNYVVTYIDVQPGRTSEAVELLKQYATAGNGGVLQEIHRPQRFVVIEAWADEPALQIHENAQQTGQFRSRLREIHNSPFDRRVHQPFAIDRRTCLISPSALFVVTHVDVPPPRKDETEILLKRVSEQSRNDEGNLRYDVFQQNAPRTNHFTVVEAWTDENAFARHEAITHTRQFREALGPMLGAPYDDRLYKVAHASGNRVVLRTHS